MRRALLGLALLLMATFSAKALFGVAPHGTFLLPEPTNYVGLINGAPNNQYEYEIGSITSTDGGATWSVAASASLSIGTGWESTYVKEPAVVWDGTQYVCFYAGYDGTNFAIGRATATAIGGPWVKDGSNPVISGSGVSGAYDEAGASFPVVLRESATDWKMWFMAWVPGATPGDPTGTTIGYATSTNGIDWTKVGQVVTTGATGQFDSNGLLTGAAIKEDGIYYIYYSGFNSALIARTGYVSTSTPASSASYTKGGAITALNSNISAGGLTWQSNLARSIVRTGSRWRITGTVWNPTPVSTEEASFTIIVNSLTSWVTPSTLAFSLASWYANSGENPSVIHTP